MSHPSDPALLVLHAVRLLGFANTTTIADRSGTSGIEAMNMLRAAENSGWVTHSSFFDLSGWSLTEHGKTENERQLAAERIVADPDNTIADVYRDFLPLNARLLRAVTDWQTKPTPDDAHAPNHHFDKGWDQRVLREVKALGTALAPLSARLTERLTRFGHYSDRFASALSKAQSGEFEWVDTTTVDSCHLVWFQLHEDLIATLGITR